MPLSSDTNDTMALKCDKNTLRCKSAGIWGLHTALDICSGQKGFRSIFEIGPTRPRTIQGNVDDIAHYYY